MNVRVQVYHINSYTMYRYCACMHIHHVLVIYVCLSGLWLGGLLYLSFLSIFLKLVCYMYVHMCFQLYSYYTTLIYTHHPMAVHYIASQLTI